MTQYKTSDSFVISIDDEDAPKLDKVRTYSKRGGVIVNGIVKTTTLGRFLLNISDISVDVDHKDRDFTNYTKQNLRVITHQQNCMNKDPYKGGKSKYKGVSQMRDQWQAVISKNNKKYFLGNFNLEEQAARAYDKKAKTLHGEFAVLNFPYLEHMDDQQNKSTPSFSGPSSSTRTAPGDI